MPIQLRRAVVCLAVGVVLSVVVAVVFASIELRPNGPGERARGAFAWGVIDVHVIDGAGMTYLRVYKSVKEREASSAPLRTDILPGWARSDLAGLLDDEPPAGALWHRRELVAFGWPMRALWYEQGEDRVELDGKRPQSVGRGKLAIPSLGAVLPTRPIWGGLVVCSVVWGAVVGVLWFGARRVRALMRTRRGRCASCGYVLVDRERCPECGVEAA